MRIKFERLETTYEVNVGLNNVTVENLPNAGDVVMDIHDKVYLVKFRLFDYSDGLIKVVLTNVPGL